MVNKWQRYAKASSSFFKVGRILLEGGGIMLHGGVGCLLTDILHLQTFKGLERRSNVTRKKQRVLLFGASQQPCFPLSQDGQEDGFRDRIWIHVNVQNVLMDLGHKVGASSLEQGIEHGGIRILVFLLFRQKRFQSGSKNHPQIKELVEGGIRRSVLV